MLPDGGLNSNLRGIFFHFKKLLLVRLCKRFKIFESCVADIKHEFKLVQMFFDFSSIST